MTHLIIHSDDTCVCIDKICAKFYKYMYLTFGNIYSIFHWLKLILVALSNLIFHVHLQNAQSSSNHVELTSLVFLLPSTQPYLEDPSIFNNPVKLLYYELLDKCEGGPVFGMVTAKAVSLFYEYIFLYSFSMIWGFILPCVTFFYFIEIKLSDGMQMYLKFLI